MYLSIRAGSGILNDQLVVTIENDFGILGRNSNARNKEKNLRAYYILDLQECYGSVPVKIALMSFSKYA